jgi:hypothetical protein
MRVSACKIKLTKAGAASAETVTRNDEFVVRVVIHQLDDLTINLVPQSFCHEGNSSMS